MSIFKAYDIRGLFPEELDLGIAQAIGRAFGVWLAQSPVAVGHDMRESSSPLSKVMIEGLQDTGLDVVDVGRCSTPMLNFSVARELVSRS